MSALAAYCRREEETARERTGQPSSYFEAKEMSPLPSYIPSTVCGQRAH